MSNRTLPHVRLAGKAVLACAGIAAVSVPFYVGVLHTPGVQAQAAPAPKFSSVSIQPGCVDAAPANRKGGDGRKSGAPAPASADLNLNCTTIAGLIHAAYGAFAAGRPLEASSPLRYLDAVPLSGGPAWIYTDKYQIHARVSGSPGQEMMRGPMMQAVLEERFHLRIRRETREVPAYQLRVADASRLQPYTGDCVPDTVMPPLPPGRQHCWEIGASDRPSPGFTPHLSIESHVQDLDNLAVWLFVMTDRPVSNQSGLRGRFFMNLDFSPDESTPGGLRRLAIMAARHPENAAAAGPRGPSLATALEQQLGLKLEPTTAFRDFLIVDGVERPGAN